MMDAALRLYVPSGDAVASLVRQVNAKSSGPFTDQQARVSSSEGRRKFDHSNFRLCTSKPTASASGCAVHWSCLPHIRDSSKLGQTETFELRSLTRTAVWLSLSSFGTESGVPSPWVLGGSSTPAHPCRRASRRRPLFQSEGLQKTLCTSIIIQEKARGKLPTPLIPFFVDCAIQSASLP
jgi:hypothetical protein